MNSTWQKYAAAGFIIGLAGGLGLVALGIGGCIIARGASPGPGNPAVAPAYSAPLAIYESFDGVIAAADLVPRNPRYVPGKSGDALCVRIAEPLIFTLPPDFLQSATVMAWVRIDNQRDRSLIWYHDSLYPSAVNYPDHHYRLSVQFITPVVPPAQTQAALSWTLAQTMQPGRFYHIAQSWGPQGYRAYLDGILVQSDLRFRKGQPLRTGGATPLSTDNVLYLGGELNTTPNQSGPGWQLNQDGVIYDDFAVFSGQLSDAEILNITADGLAGN